MFSKKVVLPLLAATLAFNSSAYAQDYEEGGEQPNYSCDPSYDSCGGDDGGGDDGGGDDGGGDESGANAFAPTGYDVVQVNTGDPNDVNGITIGFFPTYPADIPMNNGPEWVYVEECSSSSAPSIDLTSEPGFPSGGGGIGYPSGGGGGGGPIIIFSGDSNKDPDSISISTSGTIGSGTGTVGVGTNNGDTSISGGIIGSIGGIDLGANGGLNLNTGDSTGNASIGYTYSCTGYWIPWTLSIGGTATANTDGSSSGTGTITITPP